MASGGGPLLPWSLSLAASAWSHLPSSLAAPPSSPAALQSWVSRFRFTADSTWLSSVSAPAATCALYLVVLWSLRAAVRRRGGRPLFGDLRVVVAAHNFLLSAASGLLLALLTSELWVLYTTTHPSLNAMICEIGAELQEGRIYFLFYVNYLFKFWELMDSALLAARGKPIPFLHVYHHSATLVLCWSQLRAQNCVQWVPIVLNLTVHVVMYLYYALHAMGFRPWWKKLLTSMQITQFVIDLVACVAVWLSNVLHLAGLKHFPNCRGNHPSAEFGIAILASYLVLFMVFYRNTYRSKNEGKETSRSRDTLKPKKE